MGSIIKKVKSLTANGLEPFQVGKQNLEKPTQPVEAKALTRSKVCETCPERVEEPIAFLKVKDEKLKSLDSKMCNVCGCSLPYLVRQDLKPCIKW